MRDMQERLEAVLREQHRRMREVDRCMKGLADYFRGNLPEVTKHLLETIPQQREAWRQEALRKYGYDLERREWTSSPEQFIKSPEDVGGFIALANHHATYRLVMEQWKWFVQIGLSGVSMQAAVCGSVIAAYRQRPGLAANGIEMIEERIPNFPQGLALSVYLTAHVATHTSLRKNLRLRAGKEMPAGVI